MEFFNETNVTTPPILTTTQATISTLSTTDIVIGFIYTFIIPVICIFGITTNIINIIVFSNKELGDMTYKYLKVNACCNICYLSICFFLFMGRCGSFCTIDSSYLGNFYMYFFYSYAKGIPAIMTIIIQILVSVLRLGIVSNKKMCNLPNFKLTLFGMTIFSAIFYLPYILNKKIIEVESTEYENGTNLTSINNADSTYKLGLSTFGSTDVSKWLIIVTTIIRGFISLIIILVIDIVSAVKLKEHLEKKKKIKGKSTVHVETSFSANGEELESNVKQDKKKKEAEEAASRNITLMVISIGFLFFLGNAPNSISYVLIQFISRSSVLIKVCSVFSNVSLFTLQGCDIFVYYSFNKKYRSILRKLCKLDK